MCTTEFCGYQMICLDNLETSAQAIKRHLEYCHSQVEYQYCQPLTYHWHFLSSGTTDGPRKLKDGELACPIDALVYSTFADLYEHLVASHTVLEHALHGFGYFTTIYINIPTIRLLLEHVGYDKFVDIDLQCAKIR